MNSKILLTPETARKLRSQMSLSQRAVAHDLRVRTNNILKIDNTKLSRFERGEITLDDSTLEVMQKYYNEKAFEFGLISPDEAEEEIEGTEEIEQPEEVKIVKAKSKKKDQVKSQGKKPVLQKTQEKPVGANEIEFNGIMFNRSINEDERSALESRLIELESQLENALEEPVKRGFFGLTEKSADDAKAIIFTMAGCYNIIKALKGSPVFPVGDREEDTVEEDSLLNVVVQDWNLFTGQTNVSAKSLDQG